jgi:histidinol-phosphate aminotransferase
MPTMKASPSAEAALTTPLLDHVRGLTAYPPGKPIEEVQREFGLRNVVKLASNENPLGPSPRAIRAMLRSAKEMNLYPDGGGYYLRQAIGKRLRVSPEEIILGAGSDEITSLLAFCYLGPGRSIVTSEYSFVRYKMAAIQMNAETRIAPMEKLRHDPQALRWAVADSTVLMFIDNPGNPTGSMMTKRELAGLLDEIPPQILVVIDEAYYEFAAGDRNYPNSLALRKKHPNVIVTRTFSKAYGLAGVRVGYAIARREIVNDLDRVRSPFNANRMAQAAATAALEDELHLRRSVKNNDDGKRYLEKEYKALGLDYTPTWANFHLVNVEPSGKTGAQICDELLRRGVIIRPMGGYGLPHYVRISIGTMQENRKLIRELREIVA